MSGGHWEYSGWQIEDLLNTIAEDEDVKARWPVTGKLFGALAETLTKLEHDMDWGLSYDTDPDKLDDEAMANQIVKAVLQVSYEASIKLSSTTFTKDTLK